MYEYIKIKIKKNGLIWLDLKRFILLFNALYWVLISYILVSKDQLIAAVIGGTVAISGVALYNISSIF